MRTLVWLAVGAVAGAMIASRLRTSSRSRAVLSGVGSRAHELGSAVGDGWRSREAELERAVDSAADEIAALSR